LSVAYFLELAEWTSVCNALDSHIIFLQKSTNGAAMSSPPTGPEFRFTTTFKAFDWQTGGDFRLNFGSLPMVQKSQTPAVLISSPADSPVKTSALPDDVPGSQANDQASSLSSHESLRLFDLGGCSLRTYQGCSPRTAVGTSESFWERWPKSGTAWHGGYSMHNTSESPKDAVECLLSDVLETTADERYALSAKAAAGILRRASARGREIPIELKTALEHLTKKYPSV
jgi:hypothetical protein